MRRPWYTTASGPTFQEKTIARNPNTYEKRQREAAKKAKAEAKRVRRQQRKQNDGAEPMRGEEAGAASEESNETPQIRDRDQP